MKTILCTNKYNDTPRKIIEELVPEGFCLRFLDEQTQDDLREKVKEADYILAGGRLRINKEVISNASKLKMVQRSGVGLDSIDTAALKEYGIPLYVNRGVNAQSVAEHTLLLILACLRRLTEIENNTRKGVWKKQEQGIHTHELFGKTIGIMGMGSIARRLVQLLSPFRVRIYYNDIVRAPEWLEKEYDLKFAEKEEIFASCDIITLHCALTDDTKGMINRKSIEMMKEGVIIVNTARGQIVDLTDLADGLNSRKISFAGIDVHESEPISEDYPLKDIENVIITPHIAGITYESFFAMMRGAMDTIEKFDNGMTVEIRHSRYL